MLHIKSKSTGTAHMTGDDLMDSVPDAEGMYSLWSSCGNVVVGEVTARSLPGAVKCKVCYRKRKK